MELEAGYERKGFATGKALIVSEAMRKLTNLIAKRRILLVMTNQLRQNLQAMAFGDKWIEPCGKATSFHSSVKIRFETVEKLKNTDKEIIGTHTRATVRKNRLGPPFKAAEFDVYFDSGIADYASWIEVAKKKNIIEKKGAWMVYKGQNWNTQTLVENLNKDLEFRNELYHKICDAVIMQYKTPNSTILENLTTESADGETNKVIEED
jgi:recombination protein RecA